MTLIPANARMPVLIASVAVIALSIAVLARSCTSEPPRISREARTIAESAANLLARESAALAEGGKVVLVLPSTDAMFPDAFVEEVAANLPSRLTDAGLQLVGREGIAPRSEDPSLPGGFTGAALAGLLQTHAEADIVICLAGIPWVTPEDLASVPARRPKLVVLSNAQVPYFDHLPTGLVSFGILGQDMAGQGRGKPVTAVETYYRIFKPSAP